MVFQLVEETAAELQGTVLRIEKTSIHDGSGLRTVVFLKGCPLHCQWCSTPESQRGVIERGYNADVCRGCGKCIECCPQGALSPGGENNVVADSSLCKGCLACADKCPSGAIKGYGRKMSVAQVVAEICKDEVFFFHSGGGVTISGGECLLQIDFVEEILKRCRFEAINTAIETSLHAPWESVARVLPHLNALYIDVKHADPSRHKKYVGIDNRIILDNLRRLNQTDISLGVHIRIPLIPGVNDSDETLLRIMKIAAGLNKVTDVEILPYHRLGASTYGFLQLPYALEDVPAAHPEYILERTEFLRRHFPSMSIKVGGGFL